MKSICAKVRRKRILEILTIFQSKNFYSLLYILKFVARIYKVTILRICCIWIQKWSLTLTKESKIQALKKSLLGIFGTVTGERVIIMMLIAREMLLRMWGS